MHDATRRCAVHPDRHSATGEACQESSIATVIRWVEASWDNAAGHILPGKARG